MTGLHVRDAVALAPLPGGTVTIGWPPFSPLPHPVKRDMIQRRRPAKMVVSRSDVGVVSATLVRSEKYCCLVKSLMCCSREMGMATLI